MISAPLNFKLSLADDSHMKNVFDLSNDPQVRAVSIHQEKIEWQQHVTWFKEKIINPDCKFFIIETLNGAFIG